MRRPTGKRLARKKEDRRQKCMARMILTGPCSTDGPFNTRTPHRGRTPQPTPLPLIKGHRPNVCPVLCPYTDRWVFRGGKGENR